VQLDDDLRCHDLGQRLQLYEQIAGKAVLQHAANCTTHSSNVIRHLRQSLVVLNIYMICTDIHVIQILTCQ